MSRYIDRIRGLVHEEPSQRSLCMLVKRLAVGSDILIHNARATIGAASTRDRRGSGEATPEY